MPVHAELQQMVDEVLDPIWRAEKRRATARRVGDRLLRLAVLMALVAILAVAFGLRRAAPELIFFGLLGAVCVFCRDSGGPSRRRNRTRVAGA